VQDLATSKAENMLMIVKAGGDTQEDIAAGSEAAAPEATSSNPDLSHTNIVIDVESNSSQSSPSQSTSSSSSTYTDDLPLGQIYNIKHIKPKTNISQELVRSDIDERIIGLSQRKADLYNRYPVSSNPLRPPMIQSLNMVPSDDNITPSSSSHPQIIKPLSIVDPTITIESSS
jgi:hypothetical protein